MRTKPSDFHFYRHILEMEEDLYGVDFIDYYGTDDYKTLCKLMEDIGFSEMMEGVFEPYDDILHETLNSWADVINYLTSKGFVYKGSRHR